MKINRNIALLAICLAAMLIAGCGPRKPADINIEQSHNPSAHTIIAPGFGTVGIIREGSVHVFYQSESGEWLPDDASRFDIPSGNHGLLAMGMGRFGVVQNGRLEFYRIGDDNRWIKQEGQSFSLPRRYDHLTAMQMGHGRSGVGVEKQGRLSFYFFDGQAWEKDTAKTFSIPSGISGYYPLGDMTIAIRDNQKLGLYYFGPDQTWEFMDHDPFVLLLPEGHNGVVPVDRQVIAVLTEGRLEFFRMDLTEDRWLALENSHFELPW